MVAPAGEFFINLADSTHLDTQPGATEGWGLGFAVFGQVLSLSLSSLSVRLSLLVRSDCLQVLSGMNVAAKISTLPTKMEGGLRMLVQYSCL